MPPEPREIKPHPYGVELGRLVGMLKDTKAPTVGQFLIQSFSRVSPSVARKICEGAKIGVRSSPQKCGRQEADAIYQAIQQTKIPAPATDCLVPIGEELILKGLHKMIPGEFYAAATRPPAVYRGNPFLIEVGLAFGGVSPAQKISREALAEMLEASDARTLAAVPHRRPSTASARTGPTRSSQEAGMKPRVSPGKMEPEEIAKLHEAMRNVNLSEGQTMNVFRYANRVPLQFQAGRLRDHADGDEHQLAVLRPEPVARRAAQRPGDADGPHGQRVGAVHERIEGSGGQLSGNPEGDAAGLAGGGPQAGDVPPAAATALSTKASGGRFSFAISAKWPTPSAASTRPTARSFTNGSWKWRRSGPSRPTCRLDDRGRAIDEDEADFGENVIIVGQEDRGRDAGDCKLKNEKCKLRNCDADRSRSDP